MSAVGWCSTIGGRWARWRDSSVCEEEDGLVAAAVDVEEGPGPRAVAPPPIVDDAADDAERANKGLIDNHNAVTESAE